MLRAAMPEFEREYVAASEEADGELGPFEAMSRYAAWCLSALRDSEPDVASRAFAAIEQLAASDAVSLQLARPLTTEFVEALWQQPDALAAMGQATRRYLPNQE